MADFPSSIYDPREVENLPGIVFDEDKTQNLFAEDVNLPNDEIVAIEETLGTEPQGAYATVKAWLTALAAGKLALVKTGLGKANGGSLGWGIPGQQFLAQGTTTLVINTVRYVPFRITYPVTITSAQFEVTTGPISAANVRYGIYAADSEQQPTGAPLYDSGSVSVGIAFTGLKTATSLSISLQPGMYLVALNSDVAMALRVITTPAFTLNPSLGNSAIAQRYEGSQTYGTFPNPGTKWTAYQLATGAQQQILFFQWTE